MKIERITENDGSTRQIAIYTLADLTSKVSVSGLNSDSLANELLKEFEENLVDALVIVKE